MRFERITSTGHPLYKDAIGLYKTSFPLHEQREAPSQKRILNDTEYHFDLIYDEDLFVGEILYWITSRFIYVEHFCILPERRNKRYGQRALELFTKSGKLIILEIDPPVNCISYRRKEFYERCGFMENKVRYTHLPYHTWDTGHPLVIMSSPRRITDKEYDCFCDYMKSRVMKDAF